MKLAFSKLMAWVNITSFLPKVSGFQSTPVCTWLFELGILFCVAFVTFDFSSYKPPLCCVQMETYLNVNNPRATPTKLQKLVLKDSYGEWINNTTTNLL